MRYNNVQVLRFLAAASIVLLHANYYVSQDVWKTPSMRFFDLRFGWGVELFFAISGFVVSHSLERATPRQFVALRLMRIYPPFWLATAITLFVLISAGVDFGSTKGLALALTLLPVGDAAAYQLGGVEWSLVYEVFFYAVLVSAALLRVRYAREALMLVWLVAIVISAWIAPGVATTFLPNFGNIAFSAFNLPFVAGVLAYSWFSRVDRVPVIPLALLLPFSLAAASRTARLEGQLAFLAIGFASWVLVAAELSRRWDPQDRNLLVRLGNWSYGIYLVQVPVIKGTLSLVNFAPDRANLAFAATAGMALLVGSCYGAIESSLYTRCKRSLLKKGALTRPATT